MVEPKKAPAKKPAERRQADEVGRAIKSLDASNVGVTKALEYVGEGLAAIQNQRRRDVRRTFAVALVVLVMLAALVLNAYEGQQARNRLVSQSDTQTQTLQILKDATGPEAQKKAAAQLLEAFKQIDCNNQRAIQRAMTQLGYDYQLTEECK